MYALDMNFFLHLSIACFQSFLRQSSRQALPLAPSRQPVLVFTFVTRFAVRRAVANRVPAAGSAFQDVGILSLENLGCQSRTDELLNLPILAEHRCGVSPSASRFEEIFAPALLPPTRSVRTGIPWKLPLAFAGRRCGREAGTEVMIALAVCR
jgi:hypothetical protein